MPQYVILLYAPTPADWMEMPSEELEAHNRYATQIEELGGTIVSGQALQPSTTATSIRGDVVTDGPFVESKEELGGFNLLRNSCNNMRTSENDPFLRARVNKVLMR